MNENSEVVKNVNLDLSKGFQDGKIVVYVTLKYTQEFKEQKEVDCTITYAGVFQKQGNPNLTEEQFADVNGPAIIFPYIREQLSSLSLKGSITPLILPPYNFQIPAKDSSK